MFQLNNLARLSKKRKRIGRGGSRGGTSGRGHKGQGSRTGSSGELKGFFEGGQMPLSRRLPRRGFNNQFAIERKIINLHQLEAKFDSGTQVDKTILREAGLIKGKGKFLIKILGKGTLTKALTVHADEFSASAVDALTRSGGKAVLNKES